MQVALILFLTVALLLCFAFFAYHLVLILSGMTSYESYKWAMLYRRQAIERVAEETVRAAPGRVPPKRLCKESKWSATRIWRALRGGRRTRVMPVNLYDTGLLANLQDALAPPTWAGQALMLSSSEAQQCAADSKRHA